MFSCIELFLSENIFFLQYLGNHQTIQVQTLLNNLKYSGGDWRPGRLVSVELIDPEG